MCINLEDVQQARSTIKDYVKKTPLVKAPESLASKLQHQGQIYFKCENYQWTNTFKVRGAFNAILNLSEEERKRGVVTRSSGNFAQAVAYAAQQLGIHAKIVLPNNIPKIKLQLTQQYGPEIVLAGPLHEEGDEIVKQIVEKEGMTILHPYDQKNVIAGQGTIALEIYEDLPSIFNFFCPIGGGGLLSGCSTAFKAFNSGIQIVGVEPAGASDYYNSRKAGRLIPLKRVDTIADGLRAAVVGNLDWPLLQKNVDRAEIVSEKDIKTAMKYFKERMDIVVEPSGATAFASLFLHQQPLLKGDIVILISGANVDPEMFFQWLNEITTLTA